MTITNLTSDQQAYTQKRYRTVVLDFPWPAQTGGSGARGQYALMTEQQIADFPLPDLIEDDAHVWIWVTVASRFFAQQIAETRWGLTFRSELVWNKSPRMGLGNFLRGSHESLLLFTKGRAPIQFRSQRDVADWPVQGHSHKPEEALVAVMRCSPGPYLECFSRARFPGFDHWGFEVPGGSDLVIPGYPVPQYSPRATDPTPGSGDEWADGVIRKAA